MLYCFSMNDLILSSIPYGGWTDPTNGILSEGVSVLHILFINSNKRQTGSLDPTAPNVQTCLRGAENLKTVLSCLVSHLFAFSHIHTGSSRGS